MINDMADSEEDLKASLMRVKEMRVKEQLKTEY